MAAQIIKHNNIVMAVYIFNTHSNISCGFGINRGCCYCDCVIVSTKLIKPFENRMNILLMKRAAM